MQARALTFAALASGVFTIGAQTPPAAKHYRIQQVTDQEVDLTAAGQGERTLADLERAASTDVITYEGERIRFTHPLLASTLYAEAPLGQRRQLHRRLAGLVTDGEERARHLAMAAEGPDLARAASPMAHLVWLVAGASLVFLVALGIASTKLGGAPIGPGTFRVTFWGAMAMAATAGVGMLFGAPT